MLQKYSTKESKELSDVMFPKKITSICNPHKALWNIQHPHKDMCELDCLVHWNTLFLCNLEQISWTKHITHTTQQNTRIESDSRNMKLTHKQNIAISGHKISICRTHEEFHQGHFGHSPQWKHNYQEVLWEGWAVAIHQQPFYRPNVLEINWLGLQDLGS